jgi:hypothetical protein
MGNYTLYTETRAHIATSKIRERFERKPRNQPPDAPRVFPNIHLIPEAYIKSLNWMGINKCKECQAERLTWYHMSRHAWYLRNPPLVIQRNIDNWARIRDMPYGNERTTLRRKLMEDRKKWSNQLKGLLITLTYLSTQDSTGPSPVN